MKLAALFTLLTLLLAAQLSGCTRNHQTPHPEASPSPSAISAAVQKPVYVCPMHPQIRQNEPGRCPICGMDLVLSESEAEHQEHTSGSAAEQGSTIPLGHAGFRLNLEREQLIGVKTGLVEKRELFREIRAPGRVAFDPELYTAQSEYQEALKQLARVKESPLADVRHSAERMVESAKLRLKILGLSDKQILALGKAEPGSPSLLLQGAGENVWVYAEVFEMDLPFIKPGLTAQISATFLAGKPLSGTVVSVDRVLNPATRTAKVRITVPAAKLTLRPETYVDTSIRVPLGEQIAVPSDAVLDSGTQSWVFVKTKNGKIDPRLIVIRHRVGDWVAIESGLQAGDVIVTSANFIIDSESRLKAVAAGAPSHADHSPDRAQ